MFVVNLAAVVAACAYANKPRHSNNWCVSVKNCSALYEEKKVSKNVFLYIHFQRIFFFENLCFVCFLIRFLILTTVEFPSNRFVSIAYQISDEIPSNSPEIYQLNPISEPKILLRANRERDRVNRFAAIHSFSLSLSVYVCVP